MADIQITRSTGPVVVIGEVDFDLILAQAQEVEPLRKALSQRLQELEEIRQASLTWAMACPHECPACNALYEIIKGAPPIRGIPQDGGGSELHPSTGPDTK